MGRIRQNIIIDRKNCWTLFDTGSRNTYVTENVTQLLRKESLPESLKVSLGGKVHIVRETCILTGYCEKRLISTKAYVLPEIGRDEEKREIDILFGALSMQEWGIKPVPEEVRLDMSCYPKEFLEF
jgi:hypothetical protein